MQLWILQLALHAASLLLLSYLIFVKPLAIAAASELLGPEAAAVRGTHLIARNGSDAMQVTAVDYPLYPAP